MSITVNELWDQIEKKECIISRNGCTFDILYVTDQYAVCTLTDFKDEELDFKNMLDVFLRSLRRTTWGKESYEKYVRFVYVCDNSNWIAFIRNVPEIGAIPEQFPVSKYTSFRLYIWEDSAPMLQDEIKDFAYNNNLYYNRGFGIASDLIAANIWYKSARLAFTALDTSKLRKKIRITSDGRKVKEIPEQDAAKHYKDCERFMPIVCGRATFIVSHAYFIAYHETNMLDTVWIPLERKVPILFGYPGMLSKFKKSIIPKSGDAEIKFYHSLTIVLHENMSKQEVLRFVADSDVSEFIQAHSIGMIAFKPKVGDVSHLVDMSYVGEGYKGLLVDQVLPGNVGNACLFAAYTNGTLNGNTVVNFSGSFYISGPTVFVLEGSIDTVAAQKSGCTYVLQKDGSVLELESLFTSHDTSSMYGCGEYYCNEILNG